ncbi:MAG: GH29 [uncultured Thermomicrobiales bacterium]|uniref:alpha-L-fucosidase n=1 Tax=uncultured Thermomicrobiales bacterium TaxID=1645740 RepID=A0A6J4U7Y0_9BACT|nr:MAG: GH29 [uncultured Thermomicrobiales bacterium]
MGFGNTDWFTHDRFGMFIHWGLYALPARHEWVKNRERITDEAYQKYFAHFEPDLYDPVQWARDAKAAGMKYAVITSKHHEGFCLWDSQLTDYKATNTPIGRDLLAEWVHAFRAEGLKIGFYHSVIDWHHPEFPVDRVHPQRDDAEFREATAHRDIRKYADYLHGQTRELLMNYGKIDIIWFDFSYDEKGRDAWQSEALVGLVRELQPDIIINDRLDYPDSADFVTPEQYQPKEPPTRNGQKVVWEACQTLNGSWGYDRDNLDWKSPDLLVKLLVDSVSKDGNVLLNVGPTGRGEFDPRARETLARLGEWTRLHGRSVYGATSSEFRAPADCRFTQRGNRLYLHVFSWPMRHIHLEGMAGKVEYAQLLHDASEVRMREGDPHSVAQNTSMAGTEGTLTLELPIQRPDVLVPVIELFLA